MSGWIKIHRAILKWEHFREPSVVTVFLALLLSADRDGRTNVNLADLMSLTGMSHNTITRVIAKLVQSGEVTRVKQGSRIYTTISNWSEYQQDNSLTQNLGECENSLTQNLKSIDPKNGSFINPKNGSIYNNKNNNKNKQEVVAETRAHTHEDFIADALNELRVEQGCMAMRISPDEYRQLVTEVTNDWQYRDLPDNEWTLTHLLAQMRIKHNINNRTNNGKNQFSGQPSDPIDKLNRDAVKAMAALAEESQHPAVVPF